MSIQELKNAADQLRKSKQFGKALSIYQKLWEQDNNAWNGYFVALCLRQNEQLVECREFHDMYDQLFPSMVPMKTERLWLDYKQYIKDYKYAEFEAAGRDILARSDQYSKETDKVFIKTVLAVVQRINYSATEKLLWLNKLDQSILDNNVFRFNHIAYPADRKRYFLEYSQALIELGSPNDYVADRLNELGFVGAKHNEFFKFIVGKFNYKNSSGITHTSRLELAKVLKVLAEELHLRKYNTTENIFIKNKTVSVSDLSHYIFCPVSYAIQRTFKIYSAESWERDEWKKQKLYLADRYKRFHETKTFDFAFEDTTIVRDNEFLEKFTAIFQSKMELNNATTKEHIIMKSVSGKINGSPDYIYLHPKKLRFVVTEKFSHKNSADVNTPFDSDLIKQYAFLSEFGNYNIDFGLFLTWYYSHEEVEGSKEGEKQIVINSYRLHKVQIDEKTKQKLHMVIDAVKIFDVAGKIEIDGKQISFPQKCLNCSVVSYCHHKTGAYNEVNIPYEIKGLKPHA